jgi:Ser/Thr protein kinase RdoA (MazF antagonist)
MRVNRERFEPLLKRLEAEADHHFKDPAAVIVPVAQIEGPFSSLLRLRVDAAGRRFHVFLKVFGPRLSPDATQLRRWVQREHDATARLHLAFVDQPGLSAVRPIAVFPEDLALVTEEAAGVPFDRVLRAGLWGRRIPAPLSAIAAHIGAWVRAYQRVTECSGTLALDERRDYLGVRLQRLTVAGILAERDRARALARFDTLASMVDAPSLPLVGIHADLCPANILVGPDGAVTILDFAMAKKGARFHDVAHLYMHLEFQRWNPRLLTRSVPQIQAALLEGFDPHRSIDTHPLFQLMLLQHVVCHVALLSELQRGPLRPVQAWRIRRRWRRCAGIAGVDLGSRATFAMSG